MAKKKAAKKVAKKAEVLAEGPKVPSFKYIGDAESYDLYGMRFPKGEAVAAPNSDIEGRLSRNTLFERC